MTEKQEYRDLCAGTPSIPLFSRDWWLDATCGPDNWEVLIARNGGSIMGSLPYYLKKRYGQRYVSQPPLTQTSGVWINYPPGQKYERRLSLEKEVCSTLIEKLEGLRISYFQQYFHHSFTNWLPFAWKGYRQTTRYTYVIDAGTKFEDAQEQFAGRVRTDVRRATKLVSVRESCSIESFYQVLKKSYSRQDKHTPFSPLLVTRIYDAARSRQSVRILEAVGENEVVHAAAVFVWDESTVYYLLGGNDPTYRRSGANALLLNEAVSFALSSGRSFDFEGSMVEPIEHFFRGYGARQAAYFEISKAFSLPARLGLAAASVIRGGL
jgi:hypothetical protein